MIETIGIIGLGNMGRGMALSLRRAGLTTWGYDLSPAAAELEANGVHMAPDACTLASVCDLVVLSLPDSATVENVLLGNSGILQSLRPGSFLVDTTTADPSSTRMLALKLAEKSVHFIDAPVSGGPKGAQNATMLMVLGGEPKDVEAVEPILAKISAKRVHVGPVSSGHTAKLINNLLTGAHLILTREAVSLAEASGINATRLIDALNSGSGRNSATLTNYPTWVLNGTFNSGFTMKLMRKDIRLAQQLFGSGNVPLSEETARIWRASDTALADTEDFNRIVDFVAPPHKEDKL